MKEEFDRLIAMAVFENQYSATYFNTIQLKSSDYGQKLKLLPSRNTRFNILKTNEEVEESKKLATPKYTEKNTTWAIKVWKNWSISCQKSCSGQTREWPVHLDLAQPDQLNYQLSKSVLEARKENGESYPSNTLYSICCGLLWYVRE